MIEINDRIALHEAAIAVTFIRPSGPSGQKLNKVSSAMKLRFNVSCSRSLPDTVGLRLERIARARMTKDGEIVLAAENFRTREQSQGCHRPTCPLIKKATIERSAWARRRNQPLARKKAGG